MIFKHLVEDLDAMLSRDPAARSRLEIALCYPCFHVMVFYRFANWLWRKGFLLTGRWLMQVARWFTGIEIHPGATIGKRFFIDHGMGVVIGETAEIGDDVTLYQNVTLGATTSEKVKRHPTVEDHVVVGSGAQVLGPLTLGEGAKVGANAVVLKDVPPGVTVVGIPAKVVAPREVDAPDRFYAYGTPSADIKDPNARMIESLRDQVAELRDQVKELAPGSKGAETDGVVDIAEAKPAKPGRRTGAGR